MKRTLSEIEILIIKDQLESLPIAYVEIYDELLDHYVTALEQLPAEEFPIKKEALDHEFNWSVVVRMEKELLKTVSKEMKSAKMESLKFWKLDFWQLLLVFSQLFLLLFVHQFISHDVMIAFSFLPGLLVLVALLYYSGNYYSFTLDPTYHRPRAVILQAALDRYRLIFSLVYPFFLSGSIFLNNHGFEIFGMLLMIIYSTLLSIYAFSLSNTLNLKIFKMIKS
ncbi:MAG: hypothetical protein ACI9UV_000121 [Algoriphagus sp.]|jgi:uncharacterized protein YlaN (UPF0358 family)|tara:strand:- start:413 stop:1084 length:672 start_codon:yes stop_codon:yes gene_type:complete